MQNSPGKRTSHDASEIEEQAPMEDEEQRNGSVAEHEVIRSKILT